MNTRHQYLLLFFWGALLLDCYFIYSQQEDLRWFSKPVLMPVLLVYFFINASRRSHLPSKILVILALLLAWTGDMFLMREGQNNFIIGLVLFLTMHLAYIIYFWRLQRLFPVRDGMAVILSIIIVAVFDILVMRKLFPLAGELGTPLIGYMVVISLMFVLACNILSSKKTKTLAPAFFIPGAALFLLSDALLGLNMFLWEDYLIGIAVMLTYGYAQHLMVHGFIKHLKGRTA